MKTVADVLAWGLIFMMVLGLVLMAQGKSDSWEFKRSPNSGVCYEHYSKTWLPFMAVEAMSPVDDSYCEKE